VHAQLGDGIHSTLCGPTTEPRIRFLPQARSGLHCVMTGMERMRQPTSWYSRDGLLVYRRGRGKDERFRLHLRASSSHAERKGIAGVGRRGDRVGSEKLRSVSRTLLRRIASRKIAAAVSEPSLLISVKVVESTRATEDRKQGAGGRILFMWGAAGGRTEARSSRQASVQARLRGG